MPKTTQYTYNTLPKGISKIHWAPNIFFEAWREGYCIALPKLIKKKKPCLVYSVNTIG